MLTCLVRFDHDGGALASSQEGLSIAKPFAERSPDNVDLQRCILAAFQELFLLHIRRLRTWSAFRCAKRISGAAWRTAGEL
jgi:hypothetical protein